ncbi:MAG: hypothetical protein R3260_02215 [Pseudomonas sp.]|nr:hypothetical protein [Pseudomonas sp.]
MSKPNEAQQPNATGEVVPLGAGISDLCSLITFATASGIPVEEVVEFVDNGTLPSITMADFRMVDVGRLRADLLNGKDTFNEGDYTHD